jgi:hypothetical protein
MDSLPFPSNENSRLGASATRTAERIPWKRVHPNEQPPLMFQVQFYDGRVISFAYCDLRETRLRDAGFLQLCLLGMEKYHIDVVGRNLTELANLIGAGRIKSLTELGPRTFEIAESSPSIDKITVETLTGPSY